MSPGLRVAFSMIVMARMAADGEGERRAWTRASSEARVRACVNLIGRRSFMERLARIAGSCFVVRRIWERFGRSRGINGGMFESEKC